MSEPNRRRGFRVTWSLKLLLGIVTGSALLFWFAWDFYPRQRIQPKIEALATDNSDERARASNQILDIGDDAVPFLLRALRHPNKWVRWEAATLLGKMADADVAVPGLIEAMDDVDQDVPKRAAFVLGQFGSSAESAVPALTIALQHTEKYVRVRAAEALGLIGSEASTAEPALTRALNDNSREVRVEAALALWRVGGDADVAVSTLSDLVKVGDQRRLEASEAARALGEIGPAAKGAIPALRAVIAGEKNVYTARFAAQALARIDPSSSAPE